MSISVNSSSDALSTIQSLLQSFANTAGNVAGIGPVGDFLADAAKGAAPGGGPASGTPPFGMASHPFPPGTMAALIALKGQDGNGTGGAQNLFGKLDTDGNGLISQSEFENALSSSGVDQSSADALFAKLDRNGDGSIDQGELTSATRRGHGHHHHHMDADASGGAGGPGGLDTLLNASGADGAKTQTATNADGSSTTTITYADGSVVTMTTPAAQASGSSSDGGSGAQMAANGNPANLIEQLIKMQAQLIGQQAATISAVA